MRRFFYVTIPSGGGLLSFFFFFIHRLGPSIYRSPPKILGISSTPRKYLKGALAWYGKLTWESAQAWILKILSNLIVFGITLIFMVRLSFYAIPLLIYDVMNDITIIP